MADSPLVRAPLDTNEQPILDRLLEIRSKLELLKQDKSTYVKSKDVTTLYDQVVEQTKVLNQIRTDTNKRHEQNRVDTVLDDCLQLVSLSFLTVGKTNDPPAVYSAVSTIKRLLDHLKEAAFFAPKDLESISSRLQEYRSLCERGKNSCSAQLLTLLAARIDLCEEVLRDLQKNLSRLTPELTPTYEKLVSILRSLSACNTRSKFPNEEVDELVGQLKEIEAHLGQSPVDHSNRTFEQRYDEIVESSGINQENAPDAENLCKELLNRCMLWADIIKQKQGKIDPRFQDVYDKLLGIRNKLDSLMLTHAWSVRETDLYAYQRQLDRVDEARREGNFWCPGGSCADLHVQRTLLYLLRKSYALIYMMIISSEPVSEALLPIYNQLSTLKRCLIEVKKSGISSPRELYPYSMKLNSIDNMRVDGKFMVGDDVPDGQGNINQLLADCYEISYELRTQAEAESEKTSPAPSEDEDEQIVMK